MCGSSGHPMPGRQPASTTKVRETLVDTASMGRTVIPLQGCATIGFEQSRASVAPQREMLAPQAMAQRSIPCSSALRVALSRGVRQRLQTVRGRYQLARPVLLMLAILLAMIGVATFEEWRSVAPRPDHLPGLGVASAIMLAAIVLGRLLGGRDRAHMAASLGEGPAGSPARRRCAASSAQDPGAGTPGGQISGPRGARAARRRRRWLIAGRACPPSLPPAWHGAWGPAGATRGRLPRAPRGCASSSTFSRRGALSLRRNGSALRHPALPQ